MAEKRMFSQKIIDSDAFLDMPLSSQCLYFHLSMRADDDGFVSSPNKIIRIIGANKNDYDLLIAKRFILVFESGVIVIKHWKINNYLRGDRYKPTVYLEEKSLLIEKENGAYSFGIPSGIPLVDADKIRLDKIRLDIDEDSKEVSKKESKSFISNTPARTYERKSYNELIHEFVWYFFDEELQGDEYLIEYEHFEKLENALKEFIQIRASKSLLTNAALEELFRQLELCAVDVKERTAVVKKAITSGWTGFFPIKEIKFEED